MNHLNFKVVLALAVAILSCEGWAGRCKKCNANILGRKEYCARCMASPEIKEMIKREKERKKEEAEKKKKLEQKLELNNFLGFKFLSVSDDKEKKVVKPLTREFRNFKNATLYYTSERRLYKIEIEDLAPNRTGTEIVAELLALSNIFEKKYKFKFDNPIQHSSSIYITGGGQIGPNRIASKKIVKRDWTSWSRRYEWGDFKLRLEGKIPANLNSDTNTHISVSFEMKHVKDKDGESTLKAAADDEKGIDAL